VIDRLPDWYVSDLAGGGVLEERITGTAFSSPSAQIDVLPDGGVRALATHEQVLGGADAQVYMGCRFPADPAYATVLARHAVATGGALAARGVVGRVAVDFAAAREAGGRWSVHALEINLRKGGTTHPYTALRSLVPGSYDTERGRWVAEDGTAREYSATDNLVNPAWLGLAPRHAIDAIAAAGLAFDSGARTGVVLHMLSGLAIDGRLGLIAIGHTAADAKLLHDAAARAIHAAAR
jgi:PGM1 C-terminal domain